MAAQFATELLAVTLIAIVIGTGIGVAAAVPTSNNLLESQIQSQESVQTTQEQNFGRPGEGNRVQDGLGGPMFGNAVDSGNSIEYIDTINAGVNLSILIKLIGIGILLTILSSLAGIVFVLRYDPLKILANRT